MADRWTYVGKCKWNPGSNIPALSAGGVRGGNTLNSVGMQLFGNLLTNASKLPSDTLRQGYLAITGAHTTPVIDAVTFAAAMSGVSRKTARGWYSALESHGWESPFTEGIGHTQQIDAKPRQSLTPIQVLTSCVRTFFLHV